MLYTNIIIILILILILIIIIIFNLVILKHVIKCNQKILMRSITTLVKF
jgi:hypothetical protein